MNNQQQHIHNDIQQQQQQYSQVVNCLTQQGDDFGDQYDIQHIHTMNARYLQNIMANRFPQPEPQPQHPSQSQLGQLPPPPPPPLGMNIRPNMPPQMGGPMGHTALMNQHHHQQQYQHQMHAQAMANMQQQQMNLNLNMGGVHPRPLFRPPTRL